MFKTWLIRRRFDQFRNELASSRELVDDPQVLSLAAPDISAWSVAKHLEHLLLTDASILELLTGIEAGSSEPGPRPSFIGRTVLLTGIRVRGVAKAPEAVLPGDDSAERLPELVERVSGLVDQVAPKLDLIARTRWSHPHHLLGRYSASQWLRFMTVHHQHHERIIADIRRRAQNDPMNSANAA